MNREIIAEAYRISKRIKQSVNIDTPKSSKQHKGVESLNNPQETNKPLSKLAPRDLTIELNARISHRHALP